MRVTSITPIDEHALAVLIPAPLAVVPAGYPSPAQDYSHEPVSMDEHLIRDRAATQIIRVAGESMEGVGIFDGDELIVDRSLTPRHGDVVVAIVDEEFTVKRLDLSRGVVLRAENPRFPNIRLREGQELRIWGVVTYGIRHVAAS